MGGLSFAEESTAWPAVSRPTDYGGLGFTYKWNMGWMNDTLSYMGEDPVHRRFHHDKMTFGLVYAFNENFVLPLSHDEVVHGKRSLLGRMPGDEWQKFANLRAYFALMYCHPGKKLLFMGSELAQWEEWSHDRSLDWHLLQQPRHSGIQRLVQDLNSLYRRTPALHEVDFDPQGFEWIDWQDRDASVFSWIRRDTKRQFCGLRCEPDAGDSIRLSHRRAAAQQVRRAAQHGFRSVRWQQRGQFGTGRYDRTGQSWQTILPFTDIAAAGHTDTRPCREWKRGLMEMN